jgi:hypothetical protein
MGAEYETPMAKDRKLQIYYDVESDTLSLRNGLPAGHGETIAQYFTLETNANRDPNGVVLEHAAALLRPYLFPETAPQGERQGQ